MNQATQVLGNKSLATLDWRINWHSEAASHTESYYVSLNVWREMDLLPAAIPSKLLGRPVGTQVKMHFEAGKLTPLYNEAKGETFSLEGFASGQRLSRLGRFYPKGLLPGFFQNPVPFRCTGINHNNFTADFNHPLAGKPLGMSLTIRAVAPKHSERGGECQEWMDLILGSGPGLQARWRDRPTDFFADDPFDRSDEQEDSQFYEQPRLVIHLDTQAGRIIQELHGRLLPPQGKVIDLMSSWQSHLPESLPLSTVVGLGLNAAELRHNPRLTGHVIHDLNQNPRLPFGDQTFDAVICNLSVEYLTRPLEVFREVARVLRPGGRFILTFSTRWFPPKVIKIWTELHEFERLGLVLEYFLRSGDFVNLATYSSRGWPRPTTDRYFPQVKLSDPVYAVWGEVPA